VDLVTVFRVAFVVGIVAIPVLYVLFGRGMGGRNQQRARNGDEEREERERRSEEHGPGRSD
jgi:hypothetical protein